MNNSYIQNFIRAGRIAREVRAFGKELIQPGASYNAVVAQILEKIHMLGAIPAFPPQLSLDDVAAHFLPHPSEDILFSTQVVKLDVGVCVEGAIGDCAVTVDLSGKYGDLVEAAEAALKAAEQSIHVGQPLREIGRIIETTIASYGFSAVKNLSGHGLGMYKIHTPPTIPNYAYRSSQCIEPGMTFAIEPFATDGRGIVQEEGEARIFAYDAPRTPRTETARALLTKIHTFKGLPFSIHQLITAQGPHFCTKEGPVEELLDVEKGLKELQEIGAIVAYPPLVEEASGMVAQAENSVYVDTHGKVFVTT